MRADPRVSEIDAIAHARRVKGAYPETWHVVANVTGNVVRETSFFMTSMLLDVPRFSSEEYVRSRVCREVALELGCDSERVYVIMMPEESRYE